MNFTKHVEKFDDNGEMITVEENYNAVLENGTAEIFFVDSEQKETCVCHQPWKPNSDGSRSSWTDESEVVAWFKARA